MNIIKRFIRDDKKVLLGRWNIESCDKRMNHKIDLSNEDHCGPCGQYHSLFERKGVAALSNLANKTVNTNIVVRGVTAIVKRK